MRLRLVQCLARRQLERPLRERPVISASTPLQAYLRATLTGAPREQFRVLFLDKKNRLIADERMGDGTVDHAPVYPREVMRRALELNASAVILVHTGSIKTLTLNVKSVQFRPNDKANDNSPDYRIFSGDTQLGTARMKTSKRNRDYLAVTLDDPSFPGTIFAALVGADDGYNLVWSRARKAA